MTMRARCIAQLMCHLSNLSVRLTMCKNWLHSAMTFSGTLEYNQAGVHSHKRPEMDFAKITN